MIAFMTYPKRRYAAKFATFYFKFCFYENCLYLWHRQLLKFDGFLWQSVALVDCHLCDVKLLHEHGLVRLVAEAVTRSQWQVTAFQLKTVYSKRGQKIKFVFVCGFEQFCTAVVATNWFKQSNLYLATYRCIFWSYF